MLCPPPSLMVELARCLSVFENLGRGLFFETSEAISAAELERMMKLNT